MLGHYNIFIITNILIYLRRTTIFFYAVLLLAIFKQILLTTCYFLFACRFTVSLLFTNTHKSIHRHLQNFTHYWHHFADTYPLSSAIIIITGHQKSSMILRTILSANFLRGRSQITILFNDCSLKLPSDGIEDIFLDIKINYYPKFIRISWILLINVF